MAAHWRRKMREGPDPLDRWRLAINATGAAATAIALAIIVVAKFAEGAWLVILVIPCVVALLRAIGHYYDVLYASMSNLQPVDPSAEPPVVVVAVEAWNRLTHKAVELALSLSPDVRGVHLAQLQGPDSGVRIDMLRELWRKDVEAPARAAGLAAPELMVLQAQHRTMHEPMLTCLRDLERLFPSRRIAVLVPQIVKRRWYQHLLHAHRARRLRARLLAEGGPRVTVVDVPWHLGETPQPPSRAGRGA